MKGFIGGIFVMLVMCFMFLQIFTFAVGLCDGLTERGDCTLPNTRLAYIVHIYKPSCYVGRWLVEPLDKEDKPESESFE